MKVIHYKTNGQVKQKVDDICCIAMRENVKQGQIIVAAHTDLSWVTAAINFSGGVVPISHCPFCGKKINLEVDIFEPSVDYKKESN